MTGPSLHLGTHLLFMLLARLLVCFFNASISLAFCPSFPLLLPSLRSAGQLLSSLSSLGSIKDEGFGTLDSS